MKSILFSAMFVLLLGFGKLSAQTSSSSSVNDIFIVRGHISEAVIARSAVASEAEATAAKDLQSIIKEMTRATIPIVSEKSQVDNALASKSPVLIVGELAFGYDPSLRDALNTVAKRDPVLRTDAIAIRREGNRIYLVGNNDDSHGYAVSELLHRWGCRWYMPTEFGQCIPECSDLSVSELDYAYAPPFEVRRYWLSWLGDATGKEAFMRYNRFNDVSVPNGHNLAQFTKDLIPPGQSMFNVPIAEDRTAQHVAEQVLPIYAAGKDVQLGMEDGLYESDSPVDKELVSLQFDKYFQTQSYSDAFMTFYNKVARILQDRALQSKSHIGFLAYSNITLPPVRVTRAEKPLVAYLAPIDFDPIHSMDDPRSAPRRELKEILYRWSEIMEGRLVIYDYDQSMLVWRDIPNPSHQAFARDIQHYRKAGILGIDTESRGATATTFLNLYLRGQLMWDPDQDVDSLLEQFYPKFYGPAAQAMKEYWDAIYQAWNDTLATEHEYFIAPSVYTPELIEYLRSKLIEAEMTLRSIDGNSSNSARLIRERMRFTRLQFELIDAYMGMVRAANSEVDYKQAVQLGERGLAVREQLTQMNETFTTYKRIGESGYAWWPGEVQQYRELLSCIDGSRGTLVAKLPLEWSFRRDPQAVGSRDQWFQQPIDPEWETLRTDLYAQAQGVVTEDYQSYTGDMWYDSEIDLTQEEVQGALHLRFPGVFNECWLYLNGVEVAHRPFKGLWWLNDYRFEWDVDIAGKLVAGKNRFTLRLYNPHHFGGMFRRPFLYRSTD